MSRLGRWAAGSGGDHLTWVDFGRYARRVFAGDPADWFDDPNRLALTLAQAQRVIGTQVVIADGAALLRETLIAGAGDLVTGAEAVDRCAELLGGGGPAERLRAVTMALGHHFADGGVDVVLAVPSPADLLVLVGAAPAGRDPDDLDDAALLLVDLMRALSGCEVQALMVCTGSVPTLAELRSWAPMTATAAHFDWLRIARVESTVIAPQAFPGPPLDLIVGAGVPATLIGSGHRWGGGLGPSFWRSAGSTAPETGLRFGEVPPDATPELVVQLAAGLRVRQPH